MAILLKQWTALPNAGDIFSARVVAQVLAGETLEIRGEEPLKRPNLVALGSILNWADAHSTVWGAGFIEATAVVHAPPRQVLALRGPLSAKRLKQLGLASPAVFGDPGAFAAQLFPQSPRTVDLGVVPHYVDSEHAWVKRMAAAGGKVIDPLAPLERYMAELSACKRIVSSSLHGLIFAHSFGIPAAWIRLSDAVIGDGFKFRDYFASVGLAHNGQPKLTPRSSARDATDACWLPPRAIDAAALRELLVEARATLVAGPGRWWRRGRARRG